jgi:hypothetical protein
MKPKYIIGLVIAVMLALLLGCRLTSLVERPGEAVAAIPPTRTPKPTFTVTATFTPTPTATHTPTITPTPLPTNTPIPVPTATPVPTNTPAPKKPPPTKPPEQPTVPKEQPPAEQPAAPQGCAYQFCPGPWYAGDRNDAITRVYGHIKDTAGNFVNGFFVRLMCPGYEVMSFPTGPSSVAPNWDPGWYDIVMPNPYTLDCKLQVTMYKCGSWFDATCTQYDPLSEAVEVHFDAGAGETILVTDWICYHDCSAPRR